MSKPQQLARNYEFQLGPAYNNFKAPDFESAVATFCGYVDQHYNDFFEEIRNGGAGKENELVVDGEVVGNVIGINQAGTSFIIKGEETEVKAEDEDDDLLDDDWLNDDGDDGHDSYIV